MQLLRINAKYIRSVSWFRFWLRLQPRTLYPRARLVTSMATCASDRSLNKLNRYKNSLPLMRPCHILLLVFWMLLLGAYEGSGIFRARDLSMYILWFPSHQFFLTLRIFPRCLFAPTLPSPRSVAHRNGEWQRVFTQIMKNRIVSKQTGNESEGTSNGHEICTFVDQPVGQDKARRGVENET